MPKIQTLNCKRFNALELPDKADQSKAWIDDSLNKRCWFRISENQPACQPIIASVELTKPTWHVLWLENLKQDESMKHQCDRNLHILTEMSVDLNHKKFLHSILRLLAIWWSEVKLQWSRGSLGSLRQKIDLVNQAQGELTHFESDSCSGKKNGSSRAQLKLFWEDQLINGKNTFFKT